MMFSCKRKCDEKTSCMWLQGSTSGTKLFVKCFYNTNLFSQCAIPVYKGLLNPPHNKIIHELLFKLATWHGLAKLWLHTETTINSLEHSTKWLGTAIWQFESETCSKFETKDLPSEDATQACRWAAKLAKGKATHEPGSSKPKLESSTWKCTSFMHWATTQSQFGASDLLMVFQLKLWVASCLMHVY